MRTIPGLRNVLVAIALALGSLGSCANAQTLLPLPERVEVSGYIRAIIIQPDGRIVVGGRFSSINGVARQNIARLNIDGSVDLSWDTGVFSVIKDVSALCMVGNAILVGGSFFTIGGKSRNGLAAVDVTDGKVTDWDPLADGGVYALAAAGSTVYVGGGFLNIGGKPRTGIAALDVATGQATSWNPGFNGTPGASATDGLAIEALAIAGDTVYVGGSFRSIGGQPRSRLAAIDAATGAVLPWNPGADDLVRALALSGNTVYAGGDFSNAGGVPRRHLAAIDIASGVATAWNPDPGSPIYAVVPSNGRIYVGGYFQQVGGQMRQSLAALDPASGLATSWNPGVDGDVRTLSFSGNTLYVGGDFDNVAGARRASIAAIDVASALPLPLPRAVGYDDFPGAAFVLASIVDSAGRLIIGGSFDVADGYPRQSIARYLADGTVDTSWEPQINGVVNALAISANTVYVGGNFTLADGQPRNNLAAFDATSGQATTWNPDSNGPAKAMAVANSKVYAVGTFTLIDGQSRQGFAVLDGTTGHARPFNGPSTNIQTIVASANTVYVSFATAEVNVDYMFAIDALTDTVTGWNPKPMWCCVSAMAVSGATVYLLGSFGSLNGVPQSHGVAAVDATTGHPRNWNPSINQFVSSVAVSGNVIYLGGDSYYGVEARIIALDATTGAAAANFDPAFDARTLPFTLSAWGGGLFAGGYFTQVDGQPRLGAVALAAPGVWPAKVSAIEYYHAAFDHYFITALADEIAKLDAGVFTGWARTGANIPVYAGPKTGAGSVCRFFSAAFAPKSSHFYTPIDDECAIVKLNPDWTFEGDVFNLAIPNVGICGAGTQPVFRLYNNGQGAAPNHRYTTSLDVRSQMIAKGWIPEGDLDLGIIMCAPI